MVLSRLIGLRQERVLDMDALCELRGELCLEWTAAGTLEYEIWIGIVKLGPSRKGFRVGGGVAVCGREGAPLSKFVADATS